MQVISDLADLALTEKEQNQDEACVDGPNNDWDKSLKLKVVKLSWE